LALWRELEEADRIHATSARYREKVAESLAVLRAFALHGPCYAGMSGGKDSMVLAHLCACLGVEGVTIPLVYVQAVPHANPENELVLAAFERQFPDAPVTRFQADYTAIARGLSSDDIEKEKDRIFFAACRRIGAEVAPRRVLGIRASESRVRKIRMLRHGFSTENTCAPLGWWSVADVFGYLAKHNLPVHPTYGMLGGGRWRRESLRVDEIGGLRGTEFGRAEWEREYYGDVVRRLECGSRIGG